VFTKKGNGTAYVYNPQAAVDMDSQIMVSNHVEDSVQDAKAAEPILENMEKGVGETAENLVGDAGYGNQHTVETCEQKKVTPVCAVTREEKCSSSEKENPTMGISTFDYDENENTFTCPHGLCFRFDRWNSNGTKATYRTLENPTCECGQVSKRTGGARVYVTKGHLAQRKLKRILAENQDLYRRRKCTIEPVFGQIKGPMGVRGFLRRGKERVRAEWNLICAAFNIKKMSFLMRKKTLPQLGISLINDFLGQRAHYVHLFRSLVALIKIQVAPMVQCV